MLGGNQNSDILSVCHPSQRATQVGNFSQIDNAGVFDRRHSRQSPIRGGSGSSQGPIFQFPFAKATTTTKAYDQDNLTSEEWIDRVAAHENIVGCLGLEDFGTHKGIKKTVEFEMRENSPRGDKESMGTGNNSS